MGTIRKDYKDIHIGNKRLYLNSIIKFKLIVYALANQKFDHIKQKRYTDLIIYRIIKLTIEKDFFIIYKSGG